MEIDQGLAAVSYRQNPDAHPDHPNQVFDEMNRCIERKGWAQVKSAQEQEQVRDAIALEANRQSVSGTILNSKSTDALVQEVEERLGRASGAAH